MITSKKELIETLERIRRHGKPETIELPSCQFTFTGVQYNKGYKRKKGRREQSTRTKRIVT